MTSDEDVFHCRMLRDGGRAEVPKSWSCFRTCATEMIDAQRGFMPRMPEVHFDFVSNPGLQAYAFIEQGRYFIGVYSGAVYLLDLVFSRMLSDRRVLPELGNVLLETEEPKSLAGLTLNAEEMFLAGIRRSVPQCPVRLRYQNYLLESAFRFLIAHELGHIADGHLDFYLAKHGGLSILAELGWIGKSESDTLTRQSFEVIADSQAAGGLIANVPRICANPAFPISPDQGVFMSSFAFCVFFRLFGDATFTGYELTQAYPPFRLRQMLCLIQALEVIKTWGSEVQESSIVALREAIGAAEGVFSLMIGAPAATEGLHEATGQAGVDYGEKLIRHRDMVTIPALRPFAYHDLN